MKKIKSKSKKYGCKSSLEQSKVILSRVYKEQEEN
jgi:hypothetical protein